MSALSRRSLLSALGALAGTGASGVRPAQLLAAATAASAMPPDHPYPVSGGDACVDSSDSAWWDVSRPVRRSVQDRLNEFSDGLAVPVRIASKRSWSPAFKDGVARGEYRRYRALLDELDDESTGARLLRIIAGGDA